MDRRSAHFHLSPNCSRLLGRGPSVTQKEGVDFPRLLSATAITAGCQGLSDASLGHCQRWDKLAVSREWSAFLRMCPGLGELFPNKHSDLLTR